MTNSKKGRIKRRIKRVLIALGILVAIIATVAYFIFKPAEVKVLVFSKTEGFRHESIEPGIEAIRKLGEQNDFTVESTEDASVFNEAYLKDFMAVVFLNTTGNVLDQVQQSQMERFIQAGGGYVGVHSATDTEYGWPWYGKLAGAYFDSHPMNPNVQEGTLKVVQPNHASTDSLPSSWSVADEWYNYKSLEPTNNVLITVDESTYEGGTNGANHPIAWYKEYDGGRSFYTGMGHTNEQFADSRFLSHLLGGIKYAIGLGTPVDYSRAYAELVPEENRFKKTVFTQNLNEPMELDFLSDHKIIFIERKGDVHIYDLEKSKDSVIASLDVFSGLEDGLLGLAVDPNYKENNWIYLYYSENKGSDLQNLSRFELQGDVLDLTSEKILLQVPTQREECCHSAGSIEFGPDGNLYLSTGDNTSPRADGYAPIDDREGRMPWDAQKSSSNTNDLRGKILRIKPEADGSYSIPEGNLFKEGEQKTRPEIYVMGNRNPYRISIDSRTGFLYWGEIGPDANNDSLNMGPRGYDEINQAQRAGNYGWPYFVANNQAYHTRDYGANTTGSAYDSLKPINESPNNTGLRELPPSQAAMIYYPYAASEVFPALGTGGRNAMAGPIYYKEDYADGVGSWPDYFDGKLLAYDWMRGWIFAVSMKEDGSYEKMTRIVPNMEFHNTIDMTFGPDGALYILEYGSGWFSQNVDATLSRIDFIKGNRTPKAEIMADKTIGADPLTVNFSGRNSIDYDGDKLTYKWTFEDSGEESTDINPTYTFKTSGKYKVNLEVTDSEGNTANTLTEVIVGNELPELSWEITNGNSSFYWPDTPVNIAYKVDVSDAEDGKLSDGSLDASRVIVSFDYLAEGNDKVLAMKDHSEMTDAAYSSIGKNLINASDCMACHKEKDKSIGPSYQDIAEKYGSNSGAPEMLANKIINGGGGNWGEVPMAAHPDITTTEAKQMVEYILSLSDSNKTPKSKYPTTGTFTSDEHIGSKTNGTYLLTASYTDLGGGEIEGLNAQKTFLLRYPKVEAETFDEGTSQKMNVPAGTAPGLDEDLGIAIGQKDGYFMFKELDLTGVKAVRGRFALAAGMIKGGDVEFHLGSVDGELLGKLTIEVGLTEFGLKEFQTNFNKPVSGNHDLYVVFRSEDEEEGVLVGVADWFEFLNKSL
ncbi:MAG: ThuA domain-containing protein [Flavobacteriaceae bacterium]